MIKLIECLFVSIANCSLRIVGKVSTQHAVEMYSRVKKKSEKIPSNSQYERLHITLI